MYSVFVVDDESELLEDIANFVNRENRPEISVTTIQSGDSLINHIENIKQNKDLHFPNIIFLDLKLGTVDTGLRILSWLKNNNENQALRKIPVIIFSSTNNREEINRCYANRANSYVEKGADQLGRFWNTLSHWIDLASLPEM